MKKLLYLVPLVLTLTILLALLVTPTPQVMATGSPKITIAVDLAHGEGDKYLGFIQGNITQVVVEGKTYSIEWINITSGMTITPELLSRVDILLIGQPTTGLSPSEMEAILNWLKSGNRVLYAAGDSDYGPGPDRIDIVNKLLEYIGAKLRLEQAAVYSEVGRTYVYKGITYPTVAAAYYRMLAFVEPDKVSFLDTSIIEEGVVKPILLHGPTCVIWVDEEGNYRDPVSEVYQGLIRIAWFRNSYIGDNNPPTPYVYDPLLYGLGGPKDNSSFVGYAAEYWPSVNSLITVAGESLYGDYEPAWASVYYGVELDGPKFVTNLIKWWIKVIRAPVLSVNDPVGDDRGPGALKYPTNPVFVPGAFDIVKFQVLVDGEYIYLRTTFKDYGGNPWGGPNNFSLQLIHIYMLTTDPALLKNTTAPGLNVQVYHGWHYLAVAAPGWGGQPWPDGEAGALYASNGTLIAGEGELLDVYYVGDDSIDVKVHKSLLKDLENIGSWVFAVAVASYDGFGTLRVRGVAVEPQEWLLGGGDPLAIMKGVQPLVVDFLAPTADDQYTLLKTYDPGTGKLAIIAGMSKLGFMGPLIVERTLQVTLTQTRTATQTVTQTVTETLARTTTQTQTTIVRETTTTTISTTVSVPEYTTAGIVGAVALIIIVILVIMLVRRK